MTVSVYSRENAGAGIYVYVHMYDAYTSAMHTLYIWVRVFVYVVCVGRCYYVRMCESINMCRHV